MVNRNLEKRNMDFLWQVSEKKKKKDLDGYCCEVFNCIRFFEGNRLCVSNLRYDTVL